MSIPPIPATPIPATTKRNSAAELRAARLYDAADAFDESLSPAGLRAFVFELLGCLGCWITMRR